ncbi:MAG: alpha/beta fold hydrolase [Chloroflexi bacterium]|nr:alpha/beta fold hydrolase [Chloroflexota bacterium]
MEPQLAHVMTADNVAIAYTVTGSGPTLIFLPGVPLSNVLAEWRIPSLHQAYLALSDHLRLVQYDGRGTGRSQRDVDEVTLATLLTDLEAVVDATGSTRFALLGFYLSCSLAIAYAARHPERVTSLVLFGGALRGWDLLRVSSTQALVSLIERDWDTFAESATHAWYGWPDPVTGARGADAFRDATTPEIARQTMREASRIDVTADASAVHCPALVLHRTGASVVPLAVSQALAAAIPAGRLELVDGSSASLFAEYPEDLARRIAGFVVDPAAPQMPPRRHPGGPRAVGGLSPREVEVLRRIAAGESNGEIAQHLQVSINTVERHVTNLYRKIDARSRAEATAFAIKNGLA